MNIARTYYLFVALLLSTGLFAQFSPGKLSEAHAHLEGMDNCTQCHELGSAISQQKCLDCHTEISQLQSLSRGYHSSSQVQEKSCVSCHSEHHGRRFDAVRFDTTTFDHGWTGFDLEGAHEKVNCRECHSSEHIADQEIAGREGTYLGMGTDCLSCHEDYHQGTLDVSCTKCHDQTSWAPASVFDHAKTDFPLKGAHKKVDCLECHPLEQRGGQDFQRFSGIQHQRCTDCHNDPHEGSMGSQCTQCHSNENWRVKNIQGTFDHSTTRFPLLGLHASVDCKECHTSGYQKMPFARCTDCHEDYHEGDFALETGGVEDCSSCHSVERSFSWSSFDLIDHQNSSYPLEGAHMVTPCTACHQPEAEQRWSFSFESTSCVSCHENVHEGRLDASYMEDGDCQSCHVPERWSLVSFDHGRTDWPLIGLHAEVDCRECHMKDGLDAQQFGGLTQQCVDCHDDVHAGQFAVAGSTPEVNCASCHTPENAWSPLLFDHNQTEFPLTGKHAEAQCSACHTPEGEGPEAIVYYQITAFACIDCHGS